MKNIHHIIPVSRNGRVCDANELPMDLRWHRDIHSMFGNMITHEKIMHLLDCYGLGSSETGFEDFMILKVEDGSFYRQDCISKRLQGRPYLNKLKIPDVTKSLKVRIVRILECDAQVLTDDSTDGMIERLDDL